MKQFALVILNNGAVERILLKRSVHDNLEDTLEAMGRRFDEYSDEADQNG